MERSDMSTREAPQAFAKLLPGTTPKMELTPETERLLVNLAKEFQEKINKYAEHN